MIKQGKSGGGHNNRNERYTAVWIQNDLFSYLVKTENEPNEVMNQTRNLSTLPTICRLLLESHIP